MANLYQTSEIPVARDLRSEPDAQAVLISRLMSAKILKMCAVGQALANVGPRGDKHGTQTVGHSRHQCGCRQIRIQVDEAEKIIGDAQGAGHGPEQQKHQ